MVRRQPRLVLQSNLRSDRRGPRRVRHVPPLAPLDRCRGGGGDVGVQARRQVAWAVLRRRYPVHQLQRVLGLRDAHYERSGGFSDYSCRNWRADRHIRWLQQPLRGSRSPDSRHHAGPACLRIPHPSPGPIRSEWHPGSLPYGGLLHSPGYKAHQPGDPPGPPSRYGDGLLARIDDVSDAVSGPAAAGKELDHVGHQPDHYDGSCNGDNNCPGGSGWPRQGRMAGTEGGGRGGGTRERHRHRASGHHPGQAQLRPREFRPQPSYIRPGHQSGN